MVRVKVRVRVSDPGSVIVGPAMVPEGITRVCSVVGKS